MVSSHAAVWSNSTLLCFVWRWNLPLLCIRQRRTLLWYFATFFWKSTIASHRFSFVTFVRAWLVGSSPCDRTISISQGIQNVRKWLVPCYDSFLRWYFWVVVSSKKSTYVWDMRAHYGDCDCLVMGKKNSIVRFHRLTCLFSSCLLFFLTTQPLFPSSECQLQLLTVHGVLRCVTWCARRWFVVLLIATLLLVDFFAWAWLLLHPLTGVTIAVTFSSLLPGSLFLQVALLVGLLIFFLVFLQVRWSIFRSSLSGWLFVPRMGFHRTFLPDPAGKS